MPTNEVLLLLMEYSLFRNLEQLCGLFQIKDKSAQLGQTDLPVGGLRQQSLAVRAPLELGAHIARSFIVDIQLGCVEEYTASQGFLESLYLTEQFRHGSILERTIRELL